MQINSNATNSISNPSTSISDKINQTASKVSLKVQTVAVSALIAYKSNPAPKDDKQFYSNFFATHITNDQKTALNALSQRVKNITSLIASKAGADTMGTPIGGMIFGGMILGVGAALTNQENVTDLFLTQSMEPAQQVDQELQAEYSPEEIDKSINESLDDINKKT